MNQKTTYDIYLSKNPALKLQVEFAESLLSCAAFCLKIPAKLLSMPLPFLAHRDYELIKR